MSATVPAPPAATRRTPDRPCLNCGDPTPGNYCRNCGQRKIEVRVSLRRMLLEALDDQFSLNSALPRTLGALFFRPGHLTREYMNGRIARYVPPFRLYLVSSVLFFLVLSFTIGRGMSLGGSSVVRVDSTAVRADSARPAADRAASAAAGDSAGAAAAAGDSAAGGRKSWLGDVNVNTGSAELDARLEDRLRALGQEEPQVAIRRVGERVLDYLPQAMFLMMPVFAAVLKLLYLGSRRLYVEHFVFALHLHAFTFACFTVEALIGQRVVEAVIAVWILLYTYIAMLRFYGQGLVVTGIKYFSLGAIYLVLLSFAFLGTLIAALALM